VLCIDTLRADHVRSYGYDRETTPHVDALAQRGTLFETAYAHSNWTVPATASLLTSQHPSQHGAGIEGAVRQLGDTTPLLQIRQGVGTLQGALATAGVRTGLFSANPFLYGKFREGFEVAEVNRASAGVVTSAALAWLDRVHGDRFFLYLQYMDLHQPIEPPPPYFDFFPVDEGGERGPQHSGWSFGGIRDARDLEDPAFRQYRAHRMALYDGALRYVDQEIGRLLTRLTELGKTDDTVVIVTADHGEEFWDHALEQYALGGDPRNIWGIGHGHTMYEEVLRVPLVFAGPGVPTRRRQKCPARHLDVAPTALALMGVPPPPDMRGRNLLAADDASAGGCPALPSVAESPAYGPDARAVTWKGRKLILRSDGVQLLFDLRADPEERHDLAAREPGLVAGLRDLLDRQVASTDAREPATAAAIDQETRKQLQALGYLD
jgi:arylsulfatase A-like enzyme